MIFKLYSLNIIVENIIEYLLQGIILTLALFIIPSFRTIHNDITIRKFMYIAIIFTSILIIVDKLLPDIAVSFRSFSGIAISTLTNPNF